MTNIVERLRFDAARCEIDYSIGIATNIQEAAEEIERLQEAKRKALAVADERSKENVALRHALEDMTDRVEQSWERGDLGPPSDQDAVERARKLLGDEQSTREG